MLFSLELFMGIIEASTTSTVNGIISKEYLAYLDNKEFPCIAAKAALAKEQVSSMVAEHMACPSDDENILRFIYSFIDDYRSSTELFHTAAVIFKKPGFLTEEIFEQMLWQRLQGLADLDAKMHAYDKRVNADPTSPGFSFSLKEEAFYIVGLHPSSSRIARQFKYPTLVFNPHAQFEQLRETTKYDKIKGAVRKRDIIYSGSVNPMLVDFGETSEASQYTGRYHDESWECPLKLNHAGNKHHSTT
jgi:FPC/CPF motif-containing protein YcgG